MDTPTPLRQETVLIIEDDPAILFGLRDNLQRAGYEVRSAGNGQQGLELARTLRPDLVLLDLLLPGLSGHEVCRRIRADGLEMPVVMLTALGEEAQVVRGLHLGADADGGCRAGLFVTRSFAGPGTRRRPSARAGAAAALGARGATFGSFRPATVIAQPASGASASSPAALAPPSCQRLASRHTNWSSERRYSFLPDNTGPAQQG